MTLSIKTILQKLEQSKLVKAGILLTIINLLTGGFGYIYQILMGRMLSPADFALFSAVMALFMFFSSPFNAMQMVISRKISSLRGNQQDGALGELYTQLVRILCVFSFIFLIVILLFQTPIMKGLNSETANPVWLFAAILISNAFFFINNAFFQGVQHFSLLGGTALLNVVLKIVLSASLIYLGFAVTGGLSGVFLALLLTWFIGVFYIKKVIPVSNPTHKLNYHDISIKSVTPVLIANIAFAAMTQLDMVMVNKLFPSAQAGAYAAASVLGKAVLYIPGGLILVLFPMVAENHSQNKASYYLLIQALGLTFLLCFSIALIYFLLGNLIIEILYGEQYTGAGELLRWYGFAILPMSMVLVAEYFMIARSEILFTWLFLLIAPFQLALIYFWHDELWQVLAIMGGCGSILFLSGCAFLFYRYQTEIHS